MRLDLGKLQAFVEVARAGSLRGRGAPPARHALGHQPRAAPAAGQRRLRAGGVARAAASPDRARASGCFEVCGTRLRSSSRRPSAQLARPASRCSTLVLGCTIEFGATVLLAKLRPLLRCAPDAAHRLLLRQRADPAAAARRDRPGGRLPAALAPGDPSHPACSARSTWWWRRRAFLERYPVRTPHGPASHAGALARPRGDAGGTTSSRALPSQRRPMLERIVVIDHVRGMINGALAGYGVSLRAQVRGAARARRAARWSVLFPRLQLLEDSFSIYQKLARAERPANQLVTRYLLRVDVREFGDALGASPHQG